ncbi:MAG: prephenate dehydrogenase [Gemmatimonadota bacterium]
MTDEALPFRRVAIVGLGLMGGSLALALRRTPHPPRIAASSLSGRDRERALLEGAVERAAADPAEIVADADLVVYAAPPDATLALLAEHRALWAPDATITDVTSVKRAVVERVRSLGEAGRFVGSHPMTGTHGSGFDAAVAELYDGARVWLSPAVEPDDAAGATSRDGPFGRVAALWRAVGAEPATIDAETHDRGVAWSSHLPQLVASALARALADAGTPRDALGPGGRDTTRLAASPPALWAEILRQNADLLAEPLTAVRRAIDEAAAALVAGDADAIAAWMEPGRRWGDGSS